MPAIFEDFQPELKNELVLIRPLVGDDFEALYEVASDPLLWDQHPEKDRYKKEVFEKFFYLAMMSESAFLVLDVKTREVIGSSRFYAYEPGLSKVAIGYTFIARKFWGKGYNAALKKLMIDYAFQFVDTIVLHIGASNIRSQKAVLKLGAVKRAELDFEVGGVMLPHFEYVLKIHDIL